MRHAIIKAVRDYFDNHGFTLVDTPIFTPAACEGTTTLFEANYFDDEKAYLTQSGQLYNEANAMAFGKVYCFGPTFRAEKSKTRRHLTEFWMVEPEMAFADLEEIKRVAEEMVIYVVERVLETKREELKVLERDVSKLEAVQSPFVRMSYDDAVKNLQAHGSEIQWGGDFGGGDETTLTQQFDRPMIVDRFPTVIKAFYMQPDSGAPWCCRWERMYLRPKATARSSAAGSAFMIPSCCCAALRNTICRRKRSTGTSICASTGPFLTAASAWGLSAAWRGCAGWSTCAKPLRSRAC